MAISFWCRGHTGMPLLEAMMGGCLIWIESWDSDHEDTWGIGSESDITFCANMSLIAFCDAFYRQPMPLLSAKPLNDSIFSLYRPILPMNDKR